GGAAAAVRAGADDDGRRRRLRARLQPCEELPAVYRPGQPDVETDERGRLDGHAPKGLCAGVGRQDTEAVRLEVLDERRLLGLDDEHERTAVAPDPERGQLEPERRALAERALEPDPPAVRLDDLAAQRQPEPRPADLARVGRVHTEELLEDTRLLVGGDTEPLVLDRHEHGVRP